MCRFGIFTLKAFYDVMLTRPRGKATHQAGRRGSGGLGDFMETGLGTAAKPRPPDTFGGPVPSTGTTCPRRLEAAALLLDRAGFSLSCSGPSCSRGPGTATQKTLGAAGWGSLMPESMAMPRNVLPPARVPGRTRPERRMRSELRPQVGLQSELCMFSCPPNRFTSSLPVLLADSEETNAPALPS